MPAQFKDLVLDANDHQALADWWCAAMGYRRRHELTPPEDGRPRPADWPVPIVDPTGAGPLTSSPRRLGDAARGRPVSMVRSQARSRWIVPVPEAKAGKNRMHHDVRGNTDELLALGARLVRRRDDEIEWDVLADPEGNEFCVFAPDRR